MKKLICAALFPFALAACDEEPGPPVMVITAETGEIAIAANQLSDIAVTQDSVDRYLSFRMNADIAKAFGDMTTANVGKKVTITVCGDVVSEPIIQSVITNGLGQISGLSSEDMGNAMEVLLGRETCP